MLDEAAISAKNRITEACVIVRKAAQKEKDLDAKTRRRKEMHIPDMYVGVLEIGRPILHTNGHCQTGLPTDYDYLVLVSFAPSRLCVESFDSLEQRAFALARAAGLDYG